MLLLSEVGTIKATHDHPTSEKCSVSGMPYIPFAVCKDEPVFHHLIK